MSHTLVSVIIPTHNRRDFILEAVESVLAQTYSPWELIVVDDGSTDGTMEYLKAFIPPIRYFRQENKGPGAARNLGLEHASGEYIAFLDSDDRWLPEKLALQMELVRQHPDVGLVGSGENCIDEDGQVYFEGWAEPTVSLDRLKIRCPVFGGASRALIPRKVLEDVGVFDETLKVNQDWDLWLRIAKKYQVRNVERPLVEWRRHYRPRPHRDLSIRIENTYRVIHEHVKEEDLRRGALSWFHYELAKVLFHIDRKRLRSIKHLAASYRYSPRKVVPLQNRRLLLMEYVLPGRLLNGMAGLKKRFLGRNG